MKKTTVALNTATTHPGGIRFKEKLGYALGDTGCCLLFGLTGTFLQLFYTDVLLIRPSQIMVIFIVARLWDAFNDPMWGRIVEVAKPWKGNRFRHWLVFMAAPMALATIFMYMKFNGLNYLQKPEATLVYAYITYIMFGMLYTAINIPYGSLASVITTDEKERGSLSVLRSVGAGIGGSGAMVLGTFALKKDEVSGIQILNWKILIIGVSIMAVLSVGFFFLSFFLTKERVSPPPQVKRPKGEAIQVIKMLLKSRAFMTLSIASMFLIAAQLFSQSFNMYLYKDYFGKPWMNIGYTVATYTPMIILVFTMHRIVTKTGKKELCGAGMLISSAATAILAITQTKSPWVFLSFSFIAGIGMGAFTLGVWALVCDVIDYNLLKYGKAEEATTYSFYSFARKLGQTVAGILSTLALIWCGYQQPLKPGESVQQTPQALKHMYLAATIPISVMYFVMGITLLFLYPLGKKQLAKMQLEKEEYYEKLQLETDKRANLDNIFTGEPSVPSKDEIEFDEYINSITDDTQNETWHQWNDSEHNKNSEE